MNCSSGSISTVFIACTITKKFRQHLYGLPRLMVAGDAMVRIDPQNVPLTLTTQEQDADILHINTVLPFLFGTGHPSVAVQVPTQNGLVLF